MTGSSVAVPRVATTLAARARRHRPYLVAAGLALVLMVPIALRLPWGADLGLHAAVLGRLTTSPLHPGNPALDVGGSSAYYSPYMLALALIAKITGLGAFTILKLAGILNVLLLLSGLFRFIRSLTPHRYAPVLALVGLLFWWGTTAIAWSGYLSLISLALCVCYPSTFATALTFHVWATVRRLPLGALAWARCAGVGVLLAVVVLSHQFTAIGAVLGVLALLWHRRREIVRTDALRLAAGAAVTLVIVLCWPYYHIWSLTNTDDLDPTHKALYAHPTHWYGFATLGLIALAARWWRDRWDPLVTLFVACAALVGYGWVSGHYSWGRVWPMTVMIAQFALAIEVAGAGRRALRLALAVPVAAITLLGAWTQSGALLYAAPASATAHLRSYVDTKQYPGTWSSYAWITPYAKRGQVVLTADEHALYQVPAYGPYTVSSRWILPEVPRSVEARRDADTRAFFAPATAPSERLRLLREYHVTWVLLPDTAPLPAGPTYQVVAHGPYGVRLARVTY
jgi:alpha-1,6-mannosyltransferase